MDFKRDRQNFRIGYLGLALSGSVWLLVGFVNLALSPLLGFGPGVDLLYLPAGVRLVLLLLFRAWGATGIAVADGILYQLVFGEGGYSLIVINAIISGFVPLGVLIVASKVMNVDPNLVRLTPMALVVMAFSVSIVTPLIYNFKHWMVGYVAAHELAARFSAMVLGDFLGCLAIVFIIWSAIRVYRGP